MSGLPTDLERYRVTHHCLLRYAQRVLKLLVADYAHLCAEMEAHGYSLDLIKGLIFDDVKPALSAQRFQPSKQERNTIYIQGKSEWFYVVRPATDAEGAKWLLFITCTASPGSKRTPRKRRKKAVLRKNWRRAKANFA